MTDSDSWQMTGNSGGGGGAFGGHFGGGARPQTAEVIKTLGQRCPQVIVDNRLEMTDYVVRLEHEGGKGLLAHKDKVVVFVQKTGDSIFSKSTLSVGGSVQDSCAAITAHWAAHSKQIAAAPVPPAPAVIAPVAVIASPAAAPQMASLTVESSVSGADIEVDGSFVGSTPSTVSVAPGQHTITVKKNGYTDWSRTMNVSGSAVRVSAEMEKAGGAE